jgi:hypothetical protein
VQALLAVVLLVGIGAGAGAYSGMFYVTGSQFYEACQQRQAKEKIDGGFKDAEADNRSQAVLWASCTPIMGESMANAGFAIGSSHLRQQKMQRPWRVLVRMPSKCQCSPSFGTILQLTQSRRMVVPR